MEVRPCASLNLQMHRHCSEHRVVVEEAAKVVSYEGERLLDMNESTYILAGQKHRLTNLGAVSCLMVEVRSGSYVGEDGIMRFEDNYGRCK